MNYKKPTVWIVTLAVIACIIVAICFLTVPSYPSHNPILALKNLELFEENDIEVELTELKTILPMIEDLGSYTDIEFRHYQKNMFIFSSDAYTLKVTYDAENYQNEKENFSKKYVYEKDKLSDYGGYNKDPDFEMDTYSFKMLSYDNYKLQAYPHEMVFVGVSDERQEIAVVYYSDSDLDIIDSSFPEFLISECGWK